MKMGYAWKVPQCEYKSMLSFFSVQKGVNNKNQRDFSSIAEYTALKKVQR